MRLEGWEVRLAKAIEAARDTPFEWGQHDCATWVSDVRRDLTGLDAAAEWRSRYRTERGAARMMRRLGWQRISDGVTGVLGAPLATPLLAQRGDVVLAGADDALGVCLGAVAVFLAPDGLTERPITACRLAWRV